MSVPDLWYGLAEEREPAEALTIERATQIMPIFVRIPNDPKLAKALRRVQYSRSTRWPDYYVRKPPRGTVRDLVVHTFLAHRDGGVRCFYCGDDTIALEDLTLDHIIPESRGGLSNVTNLVLACAPCNNDKDNRTPEEWRAGVILRRRQCKTDEQRAAWDDLRHNMVVKSP